MIEGVPLLVDLRGSRAVVVGAGPVAAAKVRSIEPAGPQLDVIAPAAVPDIAAADGRGALRWLRRSYLPGDLDGAVLAVAATSDQAVNEDVAAEARERAVLCVRVDGGGSAAFMAAVRRGPLTLAVASGTPALTRRLRVELEQAYGPEHGHLAELLSELRESPEMRTLLAHLDDADRAALWRAILDTDILSHVRAGRLDIAKEVALACLS